MIELNGLGWTPELEATFAPYAGAGLVPGRVALEHNHVYRVLTAQGEVLAETAGRVKHRAVGSHELPVVGDWVALRLPSGGTRAAIAGVLPRRSHLSRKVAGRETEEQVLAANLDTVFLIASLEAAIKPRAIERYLVLARRSGAAPVVILNKADLCEEPAAALAEVTALATDVPVYAVSVLSGAGIEALYPYVMPGRTVAVLGPSGVGKSSLINRLVGRAVLATGEVRVWDRRGRHTSVHRQLVPLDTGGLLIDTPGMRELQLWDVEASVGETFAEISDLAAGCRFRDCEHDREPGCAVKAAVEAGQLDAGRYQGYLKLRREREALESRQDERAQLERKKHTKAQTKALRALSKYRGR